MLRKTQEEFLEQIKKVHAGDDYDYGKVEYNGSEKKIIVRCNKHQLDFSITASAFASGKGCPMCAREKGKYSPLKYQEMFLQRCKEKHGEKFDYSKVNYKNTSTPVEIYCKKHGVTFFQSPTSHLMRTWM